MPKGLLAAILLTITLLGVLFLVWPKYQTLNEVREEQRMRERQLQERESYFLALGRASQQLTARQEALAKVNAALPDEPEVARLLHFLDKASRESGLLLSQVDRIATALKERGTLGPRGAQAQEGALRETTLSLELSGDYPALKNFLSLLENSARLIEVEEMLFTPTVTGGFFRFNLNLKVHSY